MWPLFFLWDAGLMSVLIPTFSILAIFMLTVNLIRHVTNDSHIPIRDTSKKHNWSSAKLLSKLCYCSVCEALMVTGEGAYCDCCGVCADPGCIKSADKNFRCKAVTSSEKAAMKHHWVQGNLPLGSSMCYVCDEECGVEAGLVDYCCCWCQRIVHTACRPHKEEVCDFGQLRIHIVPPTCIMLTKKRSVRRKLQLREVSKPSWSDWKPLIVLANRKSGNNDGAVILSMFRHLLNPAQVVDLAEQPPQTALEWCSLLGNVRATVLVAGGDGTVGWVLNAVDKLKLNPLPGVAILPVGTGNDLSRVLGWGKEHEPELDPLLVLDRVRNAKITSLDRWMVQIQPCRHLGIRLPARSMFMYNYLSVGVDAQVTLDFHRARESPFYIYSSRLINKMLYLTYGTQQVVERGCRDLEKRLELYLDGKLMELPSIESVVVLNIPSWGAGVQMWDMGIGPDEVPAQSYNDGKLEVVALYSSFHIAQLQVGLSQPHRVGQASTVQVHCPIPRNWLSLSKDTGGTLKKINCRNPRSNSRELIHESNDTLLVNIIASAEEIKLKATAPIQVDGEPWCQHPADVIISFHNQATVLVS